MVNSGHQRALGKEKFTLLVHKQVAEHLAERQHCMLLLSNFECSHCENTDWYNQITKLKQITLHYMTLKCFSSCNALLASGSQMLRASNTSLLAATGQQN